MKSREVKTDRLEFACYFIPMFDILNLVKHVLYSMKTIEPQNMAYPATYSSGAVSCATGDSGGLEALTAGTTRI